MNDVEPPDSLRQRLDAFARERSTELERLAQRAGEPEPGDVYALPCYAGEPLAWVVAEQGNEDRSRLVPGDHRELVGPMDLQVAAPGHRLTLRMQCTVWASSGALATDRRRAVLAPDDIAALLEWVRADRPEQRDLHGLSPESARWHHRVTASTRILQHFLDHGVVRLRLSEFESGTAAGATTGAADRPARSKPAMAARAQGLEATFDQLLRNQQIGYLVEALYYPGDGEIELVATRRGLALLFRAADELARPPEVDRALGEDWSPLTWEAAVDRCTWRAFVGFSWRKRDPRLRIRLEAQLVVEIENDVEAF